MPVELTEKLLSHAAGWEAVKQARASLELGQVVSSSWAPPLLRGVVRVGEVFFRASLVIKDEIDIENLCHCRDSRESGRICAHVVAVGLHWLKGQRAKADPAPVSAGRAHARPLGRQAAVVRKASSLRREAAGTPAELCVIFPPNFEPALARGRVMLMIEARWTGGRSPLNAMPKGRGFAFSPADSAIIEHLENLSQGETPALVQLEAKALAALLPLLAGHANLTLGKASAVTVSTTPLAPPLRATLESSGEIVLTLAGQADGKAGAMVRVGNWVWHRQTLQPLGLPRWRRLFFKGRCACRARRCRCFSARNGRKLQAAGGVEANFQLSDFSLEPQAPRFLLELKGGLSHN